MTAEHDTDISARPRFGRKVVWPLLGSFALLAGVVLARIHLHASAQPALLAQRPAPPDVRALAQRLAEAVRIETISYDDRPDASAEAFRQLHHHLEASFPAAHRALRRETVNDLSLLYTWTGRDPSASPIVLMAHLDVVPVPPGDQWTHPPFAGEIADGFIWGRGAWDNKGNLYAMLAAIDALAAEGFVPPQTVHLVAGHDEEMGSQAGLRGARAVAAVLRGRGVRASFVLDEGLLVTHGVMRGLQSRVALVGVAEKGFATVRLTAQAEGGHSSSPPARTAIGALARAIAELEAKADAPRLEGVPQQMLETLAPEFTGGNRMALSNLWLFGPIVQRQMAATPAGQAMLRTTWAPTVMHAGNKDNVLPVRAEAHVNLRLLPGDTAGQALERASQRLAGLDVSAELIEPAWPPSPVSSVEHAGYRRIASAIRAVFDNTVVAPGLMVGATDSRHLLGIADQVYRFSPIEATPADLPRFHGRDERLSIATLALMVSFYRQLLSDAPTNPSKPANP
jgi:carboxypeptidase PM20D1